MTQVRAEAEEMVTFKSSVRGSAISKLKKRSTKTAYYSKVTEIPYFLNLARISIVFSIVQRYTLHCFNQDY